MAITIPNRELCRPVTTPYSKPGNFKSGFRNPCPVRVAATGASTTGNPLLEPAVTRAGYYGFQCMDEVPANAAPEDNAVSVVVGCMVKGFAGVLPGVEVYVDETARPDPEVDFSGLTQTPPVGDESLPIGVGATTTKIWFYSL